MKKSKTVLWFIVPLVAVPIILAILSFFPATYELNNPVVISSRKYISYFYIPELRKGFLRAFLSETALPFAVCGFLCVILNAGNRLLRKFRGVSVKSSIFFPTVFAILIFFLYVTVYPTVNIIFGIPYDYRSILVLHLDDLKPMLFSIPVFLFIAWLAVFISFIVWLAERGIQVFWKRIKTKSEGV
jgi:hypothetical protein